MNAIAQRTGYLSTSVYFLSICPVVVKCSNFLVLVTWPSNYYCTRKYYGTLFISFLLLFPVLTISTLVFSIHDLNILLKNHVSIFLWPFPIVVIDHDSIWAQCKITTHHFSIRVRDFYLLKCFEVVQESRCEHDSTTSYITANGQNHISLMLYRNYQYPIDDVMHARTTVFSRTKPSCPGCKLSMHSLSVKYRVGGTHTSGRFTSVTLIKLQQSRRAGVMSRKHGTRQTAVWLYGHVAQPADDSIDGFVTTKQTNRE